MAVLQDKKSLKSGRGFYLINSSSGELQKAAIRQGFEDSCMHQEVQHQGIANA